MQNARLDPQKTPSPKVRWVKAESAEFAFQNSGRSEGLTVLGEMLE